MLFIKRVVVQYQLDAYVYYCCFLQTTVYLSSFSLAGQSEHRLHMLNLSLSSHSSNHLNWLGPLVRYFGWGHLSVQLYFFSADCSPPSGILNWINSLDLQSSVLLELSSPSIGALSWYLLKLSWVWFWFWFWFCLHIEIELCIFSICFCRIWLF